MTTTQPSHPPTPDPTLEVAEEQLAMLGELAKMGMVVSRAYAAASIAAAHAVEEILADEYWQPETGRARALAGAKDAADSFQKVSRALRLTLMLRMSTAEMVRDLREGAAAPKLAAKGLKSRDVRCGEPAQPKGGREALDPDDQRTDAGRAGSDAERLVEFERPDIRLGAPFQETVDRICADLGVTIDWSRRDAGRTELRYETFKPKPAGWECRPPPDGYVASRKKGRSCGLEDRGAPRPP